MRTLLKRLRTYPPVNRAATTSARAVARVVPALASGAERHLPRTGIVGDVLPNGRRLVLEGAGDEPWSNALYWRGWDRFYEPETVGVFFELASTARVTLDVGANVGIFSLLAGHANPAGRVVAFEPDPRAFRRLVRHVELNDVANVSCQMIAVSDTDGDVTLYSGAATRAEDAVALSAQTSRMRAHVEAEGWRVERVDEMRATGVTLDAFVAAHRLDSVDLVKIDVEGAEAQVLAGMSDTLRRHRPTLVCEVLTADAGKGLEEVLEPYGYRWSQLTWAGPVPRDHVRPVGVGVWPNYLFTRPA
ncbi:MAG TPA: FkbM family methyltransferase [Acidimicrobiales bacterium]|nr:FkbM family methyltransferase [Acidimicrobiales bacterium]